MAHRIKVVGCPGSGKSTLAARLAKRHGLVHVELDALYHQRDWRPRPVHEFQRELRAKLDAAHDVGWVVDGNYRSKLEGFDVGADTIVWLDLPRHVVMGRLVARTLRRGLCREMLWNGNRERLRNMFRWAPEDNIVRWAWVQYPVYRKAYERAVDESWSGLRVHRLRTPLDVEEFLSAFGPFQ